VGSGVMEVLPRGAFSHKFSVLPSGRNYVGCKNILEVLTWYERSSCHAEFDEAVTPHHPGGSSTDFEKSLHIPY